MSDAELHGVVADYDLDGIHFHDNDFLADEKRARDICDGIVQAGLHRRVKWSIQARAGALNRDLARLLKRAGCVLVEIGVETGTQAERDRVDEGTTPQLNREAIAICRRAGLEIHAYMLTALEGETVADLKQRLAWLKRSQATSFQWTPLAIYPGTALYAGRANDSFASHDWTLETSATFYSTDPPSAVPPDERRAWMDRRCNPYARRHWWRHAPGRYPLRQLVRPVRFQVRQRLSRLKTRFHLLP